MQSYSVDLRQRIVAALDEESATIDSVARRFAVSSASVKRYKRQFQQTGTLLAKPWPGRVPKIAAQEQERLKEMVASRTDWTLQTLCWAWNEQTGGPVSISAGNCRFALTIDDSSVRGSRPSSMKNRIRPKCNRAAF